MYVCMYMLHCDYKILCANLSIIIVAEPTTTANLHICKLNHFINRVIIAKIYILVCAKDFINKHTCKHMLHRVTDIVGMTYMYI